MQRRHRLAERAREGGGTSIEIPAHLAGLLVEGHTWRARQERVGDELVAVDMPIRHRHRQVLADQLEGARLCSRPVDDVGSAGDPQDPSPPVGRGGKGNPEVQPDLVEHDPVSDDFQAVPARQISHELSVLPRGRHHRVPFRSI